METNRVAKRRFLGYMASFWKRKGGKWYGWIEAPTGEHIFINAPNFARLQGMITEQIQKHHTSIKREETSND